MAYIVALDIENLSQGLVQPLQLIHQQHANLYTSLAKRHDGEQAVSYLNRVAGAMLQPALLPLPDVGFYTLGVQPLCFRRARRDARHDPLHRGRGARADPHSLSVFNLSVHHFSVHLIG